MKWTRRNFRYKSKHAYLEKLAEAKELFKRLLSEKASAWMKDYLKALGHKRGKEFWGWAEIGRSNGIENQS